MSFGNPQFFGLSLEHEAIAWGLLIGAFILRKRLRNWFLPLVAVSFIGIISEPLFTDFYTNFGGSLFSLNLGLALSAVIAFLRRRR